MHLDRKYCTCKEYQDLQLPCRHALAVLSLTRNAVREHIPSIYDIGTHQLTYEPVFDAVDWNDLEDDENCSACEPRRERGRPTKRRRRHGERIYNRINRCSACLGHGHTRRSSVCPMFGTGRTVIVANPGNRGSKVWQWMPGDGEESLERSMEEETSTERQRLWPF